KGHKFSFWILKFSSKKTEIHRSLKYQAVSCLPNPLDFCSQEYGIRSPWAGILHNFTILHKSESGDVSRIFEPISRIGKMRDCTRPIFFKSLRSKGAAT